MTEAVDLKPCPFCGAKPFIWHTRYGCYVECIDYDADLHRVTVRGRDDKEAVEFWNRMSTRLPRTEPSEFTNRE